MIKVVIGLLLVSQMAFAGKPASSICFESENDRCYLVSGQSISVRVSGRVVHTKKIKEDSAKKIRKEFDDLFKIPGDRSIAKIFECSTPVRMTAGKKSRQVCFFKLPNKYQGKISDWVQLISENFE